MARNGRFLELFAIELACGCSIRDAAKKIGCSERQAYRLATDPAVQAKVTELRSNAASEAVGLLSSTAAKAVTTLQGLLGDENDPAIRLHAAKAVLSQLVPLATHFDLRSRIEAIENATKEKKP